MKIAITAQGQDKTSPVDPRFGRARYLVVVDTETGEFAPHDNTQNLNAVQGAGIQAAQNLVELGVDAVVTGNIGPKAFAALGAANVKIYSGAQGDVETAMADYSRGKLECRSAANVQGHWS